MIRVGWKELKISTQGELDSMEEIKLPNDPRLEELWQESVQADKAVGHWRQIPTKRNPTLVVSTLRD